MSLCSVPTVPCVAMESLNEIFEEILHSEENFTAKITELRNINALIEDSEKELREAKSVTQSLYGEYLLMTQRKVDCSAHTQLWKSEYEALLEQERDLDKESKKLKSKLEKLEEEVETEREHFISAATEFSLNYDLCGNGISFREQKEKAKIDILKKELVLLENESQMRESQRTMAAKKSTELKSLELEIRQEAEKQAGLQEKIDELKGTVLQLKQEKELLDSFNTNDAEFQRMQRELDACRNCPEEKECVELLKELQTLQSKSYKKQMKHLDTKNKKYPTQPTISIPTNNPCQHRHSKLQLQGNDPYNNTTTHPNQPSHCYTIDESTSDSEEDFWRMDHNDEAMVIIDELNEYDLASIEAIEYSSNEDYTDNVPHSNATMQMDSESRLHHTTLPLTSTRSERIRHSDRSNQVTCQTKPCTTAGSCKVPPAGNGHVSVGSTMKTQSQFVNSGSVGAHSSDGRKEFASNHSHSIGNKQTKASADVRGSMSNTHYRIHPDTRAATTSSAHRNSKGTRKTPLSTNNSLNHPVLKKVRFSN